MVRIKPDPEESEDVRFFDIKELPQNINPTDKPVLDDFKEKFSKK